jgi:hypothetical protein
MPRSSSVLGGGLPQKNPGRREPAWVKLVPITGMLLRRPLTIDGGDRIAVGEIYARID